MAQQNQGVVPDFNLLYEQGEAIRQDTIRLLRMKEGRGRNGAMQETTRKRED